MLLTKTHHHSLFNTVPIYLQETKNFYDWSGLEMERQKNVVYVLRKLLFLISGFVQPTLIVLYIRSSILAHNTEGVIKAIYYEVCFITAMVISCQWILYKKDIIKRMENVDVNVPDLGDDNVIINEMIEKENKKKKIAFNTLCGCGVTTITTSLIGWMVFCLTKESAYEEYVNEFNKTIRVYTPDLPSPIYITSHFRTSLTVYFGVGCFACLCSIILVFVIAANNTLLCAQITFACLHLNILKFLFQTIRKRSMKKLDKLDQENNKLIDAEMEKEIKRCAVYLESILELCAFIEKRYSFIILIEILTSIGITALSLMTVINTPLTDGMYVSHIFLVVSSLAITSFYCYFGNEMTTTAAEIPSALYESEWIGCSKSFKTSTLIIMTRMRKPVNLTIAGISPVTLDTFFQICRLGYSAVAVLKRAQ